MFLFKAECSGGLPLPKRSRRAEPLDIIGGGTRKSGTGGAVGGLIGCSNGGTVGGLIGCGKGGTATLKSNV